MEEKRTNNTKKGILIGVGISALLLTGFLGSYAYFMGNLGSNKNEEVSTQAGTLSLTFADGNNGITEALEFGGSVEKTFRIENTGSLDAIAKINWNNITNNYIEGSLTYSLSYSETGSGTYTEVITNENVPRSEIPQNLELANGLTIPVNNTYYYKLTITLNYLDDVDQTADLKASLSTHFSIEEGTKGENLLQTLLAKTNDVSITDYNLGVKEEMFTFNHDATEQTEALTDYRYIGNIPNNYIQFNDETWRIIGVFTVEGKNNKKEQRIKIIRDEPIGNIAWNSNNVNEWATSTLLTLLNKGDYFNRINTYSATGLTIEAKKQISPVKWYLGGPSNYSIGAAQYYSSERSTTTYQNKYTTSTIQNVGLIYPSDYLYVFAYGISDQCIANGYNCGDAKNNWLYLTNTYEWSITHQSSSSSHVITLEGRINSGNVRNCAKEANTVRSVVYLKNNIRYIEGDGSKEYPYILVS